MVFHLRTARTKAVGEDELRDEVFLSPLPVDAWLSLAGFGTIFSPGNIMAFIRLQFDMVLGRFKYKIVREILIDNQITYILVKLGFVTRISYGFFKTRYTDIITV